MRCELRLPAVHAALWDHQVQGRVLLPGTAFMEAASAGARVLLSPPASLACGVVGVVLVAPCVLGEGARGQGDMLSEGSGRRLEMHVGATGTVRVTSPSGQLHVQAGVGAGHKALPVREVVREKAGTSSILGSSWSPATRACSRAEVSCGRTSAAHQGYQVHPAAMDCALHLGVENLRAGENTGAPQVPASAGAYFSDGAISGEVRMEALAGKVGEWAGGRGQLSSHWLKAHGAAWAWWAVLGGSIAVFAHFYPILSAAELWGEQAFNQWMWRDGWR